MIQKLKSTNIKKLSIRINLRLPSCMVILMMLVSCTSNHSRPQLSELSKLSKPLPTKSPLIDHKNNIHINKQVNNQKPKNQQSNQENLAYKGIQQKNAYFNPRDNQWKISNGIIETVCQACTIANGFSSEGQIKNSPVKVVWHEVFFILKNDLDENPSIDEVRALFESEYSADPQWFATFVSQIKKEAISDDIYRIIIATELTNSERDDSRNFAQDYLMDSQGALMATYSVQLMTPLMTH